MSLFTDLLADPKAKRILLLEQDIYVPAGKALPYPASGTSTGQVVTVYLSEDGFTSEPTDTPANMYYNPRISSGFNMRRSMYSPERIGGESETDYGDIEIRNDDGFLDTWRGFSVDGQRSVLKAVGVLSNGTIVGLANSEILMEGTAAGDFLPGTDVARIRIRGNAYKMEVKAQKNSYRGHGYCVQCDGVDDSAISGTVGTVQQYTAECWFRCLGKDNTYLTNQHIIALYDTWATNGIDFYCYLTGPGWLGMQWHRSAGTAGTGFGSWTISDYDYRDSKWHHLAVTVSDDGAGNRTASMIVDGVLLGTCIPPVYTAKATAKIDIGGITGTGGYGNFQIDEVRYWNFVKTPAQIRADMGRELDGNEDGLVDYWQLNDNAGTSAANAVLGRTAMTLNGGALWKPTNTGNAGLAGKKIPRVLGRVHHAELYPVDQNGLVYQGHDSDHWGQVARYSNVYEGGAVVTPVTGYSTDLVRGTVTLVNKPTNKMTADLNGELPFGAALQFMGSPTASLLNAGNWPEHNFVSGNFSIEFWLFVEAAQTSEVAYRLIRRGTVNTAGYEIFIYSDSIATSARRKLAFRTYQAGAAQETNSVALTLGRWTHVALVRNGAAAQFYVNGVPANSVSASHVNPVTYSGNLCIGSDGAGAFILKGTMDDVRVWDTARTAAQVRDNMLVPVTGLESGLIGYYPMSEGTGSTTAAKNLHNTWLLFDGSNDFVDLGTSTSLDFTSAAFTYEAWIYPTSTAADGYILSRGLLNTDGYFLYVAAGGALTFKTNQAAAAQTTSTAAGSIVANAWQHVAIVRSGTAATLYINGVSSNSVSGTHTNPLTCARNAFVGKYNGGTGFFAGRIRDIRGWAYARAASDIVTYMRTIPTGAEWGLGAKPAALFYLFDEGTGTAVDDLRRGVGPGALGATTAAPAWQSMAAAITSCFWQRGVCSPAALSVHLVRTTTGIPVSLFNLAAWNAAHALVPFDSGYIIDDENVNTVVDALLNWTFWWGIGINRLLTVGQLVIPTGVAVASYDDTKTMDPLTPIGVQPPAWQIRLGWGKTWTVQSAKDVAGILATTPAAYHQATQEWRFAEDSDDTILARNPTNARILELKTPLYDRAGVNFERDRLFAIFKVAREMWKIPFYAAPLDRDIGDEISILDNRALFNPARNGIIVGFEYVDYTVTADLWM